jgi:endo-1,4-beta-D-glucanase Y
LKDIAGLGDFRGLPIHAEIRIDARNRVRPIEVNPLRFAGWCSTDIAYYAYGINVYEYFAERKRPEWEAILKEKDTDTYAMAVIERTEIVPDSAEFDYEKLGNDLSAVLSLRKIDYRRFPLYAFVFFRVGPETEYELHRIQALNPGHFVKDRPLKEVA